MITRDEYLKHDPRGWAFDPTVISYRFVINDAQANPWESMSEIQPPTLTGLIHYLERADLTEKFYIEKLKVEATHDSHIIEYGMRRQFYVPSVDESGIEYLRKIQSQEIPSPQCPFCGGKMEIWEQHTNQPCPEECFTPVCRECEIRIFPMTEFMTKREISDKFEYLERINRGKR